MKASLILFLIAITQLQARNEWTIVSESELSTEEGYEWQVWSERAHVEGTQREKISDPYPEFEVDFRFAVKPAILKMIRPEYSKYEDGWFAYINCGEFGGGLCWYSNDGMQRQEIAKDLKINGITEIDGQLFIYGGLAHLSPPYYGFVRKLELVEGQWALTGGVRLPSPVLLLAKPNSTLEWNMHESLWVVCGTLIGRYHPKEEEIEYIYGHVGYGDRSRCLWKYQAPNSIASDPNGRIYLGTDIGVLRLPDENWVVPKVAQSISDSNSARASETP